MYLKSCVVFCLCLLSLSASAFLITEQIDDKSRLKRWMFLDMQSYEFNRLDNLKWQQKGTGLRYIGGSLGLDELYHSWEVKLKQELVSTVYFRFDLKQREFYEIKPIHYLIAIDKNVFEFKNRVIKNKMRSKIFFQSNKKKFDFIYIDGSHFYDDVLNDAKDGFHALKKDSYMLFDDYTWNFHKRGNNPINAINFFLKLKVLLQA